MHDMITALASTVAVKVVGNTGAYPNKISGYGPDFSPI